MSVYCLLLLATATIYVLRFTTAYYCYYICTLQVRHVLSQRPMDFDKGLLAEILKVCVCICGDVCVCICGDP